MGLRCWWSSIGPPTSTSLSSPSRTVSPYCDDDLPVRPRRHQTRKFFSNESALISKQKALESRRNTTLSLPIRHIDGKSRLGPRHPTSPSRIASACISSFVNSSSNFQLHLPGGWADKHHYSHPHPLHPRAKHICLRRASKVRSSKSGSYCLSDRFKRSCGSNMAMQSTKKRPVIKVIPMVVELRLKRQDGLPISDQPSQFDWVSVC